MDGQLYNACWDGNLEKALHLVKLGADANCGLRGLCMTGQYFLAEKMIEFGAKPDAHILYVFDCGLYNACLNGDLEKIDLMAKLCSPDFDDKLIEVCYKPNLDVIMKMIELGARDVYRALHTLIEFNHFYVAKKFIKLCVIIKKENQEKHYKDFYEWLTLQETIKENVSEFINDDLAGIITDY